MRKPAKIDLKQWQALYRESRRDGQDEPDYGGPLERHLSDGDFRLSKLAFDNSAAALRLWNFLLSEEERLKQAKEDGKRLVGTMKDLGTVPVMVYSLPDTIAFYPDGAWWIPCVMELSAGLLQVADDLGVNESFCPVRAMLGAFVTEAHFPIPDLLFCSVGATCDDFSAIAQRLNGLGFPIEWWEIPHRRCPDAGEEPVALVDGLVAPSCQVDMVRTELARLRQILQNVSGSILTDEMLTTGIQFANRIRHKLTELRQLVFTAESCPLPALELQIAEMLVIHFCSDREECLRVLDDLLNEVRNRVRNGMGVLSSDAVKTYWVNPVADLRVLNILEDCGLRLCGSDFMFCHALAQIPVEKDPLTALAKMALADPMVGSVRERALRIANEAEELGSEAIIISRIPGASHCAFEAQVIYDIIEGQLAIPVLEIEVPPLCDAMRPGIENKFQALRETVDNRMKSVAQAERSG